jgi:hypothetical protein
MSNTEYNSKLYKNKALGFGTVTLLSALTVAGASLPARAVGLTWTLNDVKFDDGGTATGTFDYDADTDTLNNLDIEVTGPAFEFSGLGSSITFTDSSFSFAGPGGGLLAAEPSFPFPFVGLQFETPLTNAGGEIDITLGSYGTLLTFLNGPALESGTVASKPTEEIPEPLTILGTGLALGFGGLFKKKMSLSTSK